MKIIISSLGDTTVSRKLYGMSLAAEDAREAFRDIARFLRKTSEKQFQSEGSFGSGGWTPLNSDYVARKRRAGLDTRILHATLRLRDSLEKEHHADHKEEIWEDAMVWGTNVPYARFHQQGEGVPRRKPIELRESDKTEIEEIILEHIRYGRRRS